MFHARTSLMFASLALVVPVSLAGMSYELTPTSGGLSERTVSWCDTIDIDFTIALTSDTLPAFNSAIFQVRFTEPGLVLNSYAWDTPFGTGDLFDDSTPKSDQLPLPIDGATHTDPQAPSLIDIEFSNVSIAGGYDTGDLVTISLTIPGSFGYTGPLFVSVSPDTFANGFDELIVEGGQVLQLNVIPAPASAIGFAVLALGSTRRRRAGE